MKAAEGYHTGPRQQYRYFAVSFPSQRPLVHAMRPDAVGRTACFRQPESWTRVEGLVTCSRCLHWIASVGAEVMA